VAASRAATQAARATGGQVAILQLEEKRENLPPARRPRDCGAQRKRLSELLEGVSAAPAVRTRAACIAPRVTQASAVQRDMSTANEAGCAAMQRWTTSSVTTQRSRQPSWQPQGYALWCVRSAQHLLVRTRTDQVQFLRPTRRRITIVINNSKNRSTTKKFARWFLNHLVIIHQKGCITNAYGFNSTATLSRPIETRTASQILN
jgi:hypothetical protein